MITPGKKRRIYDQKFKEAARSRIKKGTVAGLRLNEE
jgi:hypothetical protein